MVEFRTPLHVTEAGICTAFRLPVGFPDPLEVQQLKRVVWNGSHLWDKTVLREKSAEISIRHSVFHYVAAIAAVGVVDQERDGDRFFSLLEVHADQALEGGHALGVQLRETLG